MGNISYCRFENTLSDLRDCYDHMDESMEDKSNHEKQARKALVNLCCDIALDYAHEVGRDY